MLYASVAMNLENELKTNTKNIRSRQKSLKIENSSKIFEGPKILK